MSLGPSKEHSILVSFDVVTNILVIIIPFVWIGVVHMKFQKISEMLEVISHCSLLQHSDKYLVVVS